MTTYMKMGNCVRVSADGAMDIGTDLPAANYVVQFDERAGEYFLEETAPFLLPSKMYGDINKTADRIIYTYTDRSVSTGVLLSGDKGSGKTLLAKRIGQRLLDRGIATLIINENLFGEKFNQFIQSIDQPCVIIFDEFEKVYKRDEQTQILTLLDGVFSTKKLFILTTNDPYRIDEHMQNRPGRLFYNINYTGLEVGFIREYCNDVLNNKTHIDEICKLSTLFASFNFDILKALVEEMNRFDESPKDALKLLNAYPEDSRNNKFKVSITIGEQVVPDDELYDEGDWSGNPMSPSGVTVDYVNPERKNDEDAPYWASIRMMPQHLKNVDFLTGAFTFVNGDFAVTLTRDKHQRYVYNAF